MITIETLGDVYLVKRDGKIIGTFDRKDMAEEFAEALREG